MPSALAIAELGHRVSARGRALLVVAPAFGRLPAVINFLYWVTNPVWLGGSLALTAAKTVEVFFSAARA